METQWMTSETSYLIDYWKITDVVDNSEYWKSIAYWLRSAELFLMPHEITLIQLMWPPTFELAKLEFVEAYIANKFGGL